MHSSLLCIICWNKLVLDGGRLLCELSRDIIMNGFIPLFNLFISLENIRLPLIYRWLWCLRYNSRNLFSSQGWWRLCGTTIQFKSLKAWEYNNDLWVLHWVEVYFRAYLIFVVYILNSLAKNFVTDGESLSLGLLSIFSLGMGVSETILESTCSSWVIGPSETKREIHLFQQEVFFLSCYSIVTEERSYLCFDPELRFVLSCHEMNVVRVNYFPNVLQGKYSHWQILRQLVW